MIDQETIQKMHTNQRLIALELLNRGIDISDVDPSIELILATYKNHHEYILDRFSSLVSYTQTELMADKFLTKKILKDNNIQTPSGNVFDLGDNKKILLFAKQYLKFPLVIKPNRGSHGDYVYMDIDDIEELYLIIKMLYEELGDCAIVLEEQFCGKEYRIFITRNGDYAVLHREPAYVIGDGKSNIQELVDKENFQRIHNRINSLCPIQIEKSFLQKRKISINNILSLGEKIYVRNNSNIAKGGDSIDYTDLVHPSVIDIAQKTLSSFYGASYMGIDFMTKDITQKQTSDTYTIIEINSNPGTAMHMQPAKGKPRDVASMLVDLIFPETKPQIAK